MDNLKEGLDHFEGGSPENFLFSVLPVDQTGKLPGGGNALGNEFFRNLQGIDGIVLRVEKSGQGNGNDLFHFPAELGLPGVLHSAHEGKYDPPPAGKGVGWQGPQEFHVERAEPQFLPALPQGIPQKKKDLTIGLLSSPPGRFQTRSPDSGQKLES